jgi:ABC-2 type transport system permease protein
MDAFNIGGALSIPLLLFGIVGATGEFRHRTLAPAVLISPHRARLTLARLVAYAFTAALTGVAMVAVALIVGLPLLAGQPGPDMDSNDYLTVIAGGIIAATLSCALGVGIGVLVKNQVAGVVGALVYLFIIEPLLPLIDDVLAKGSILNAAGTLGGADSDELTWLGGLLVLGVWAGVAMAVGLFVDARRDVD